MFIVSVLMKIFVVSFQILRKMEKQVEIKKVNDLEGQVFNATVRRAEVMGFAVVLTTKDTTLYDQVYDTENQVLQDDVKECKYVRITRILVDALNDIGDAVEYVFAKVQEYRREHKDDEDGKIPMLPEVLNSLLKGSEIEVEYYLHEDEDSEVPELRATVTLLDSPREMKGLLLDEYKEFKKEGLKPYLRKNSK